MKRPHVIPFQIAIGPRAAGGIYPVCASTEVAETTSELELPAALLALGNRLLQPGLRLPIGDAPAVGLALGQALFAPTLRDMLLRSTRSAARDGGRLQLQLQIAAPELASLPWEWITIGAEPPWSPALHDDYALVRVDRDRPPALPAAVAGPLRVLAIASSAEDLQLEALHAALQPAIHEGEIELRLLPHATPQHLARALSVDMPHVLHCAAAVGFSQEGVPQLQLGSGLTAFDLAVLVGESPDLRLVMLSGQQGDARTVCTAAPLLAATLISDELPATIAFSAPLPAPSAARFAAECYGQLAAAAPADLAITAARRALDRQSSGRGWGFAQLRLLPGGEQLFAFNHTQNARQKSMARSEQRPRTRPAGRTRQPASSLPQWLMLSIVALVVLALLLAWRSASAPANVRISMFGISLPTAVPSLSNGNQARLLLFSTSAPPSPTPTVQPTPMPAPNSYATLVTSAGDTLESIAARLGSDAAAIAALNHLDPQVALRPDRPLVIPVFQPGATNAGGLLVNRGNPAQPKVALTFDIEIDATSLYDILGILRARNIKGTFFVTGHWVTAFPDAARAIAEQGHEIANHSLSHPYFSHIGLDGAASELEQTERIVRETTGSTTRPYFRFPYGNSTPDTIAIVGQHGYIAYHWSADDPAIESWLDHAAQDRASANGGILLMHGRQSTVAALPGWLDRLASLGLQPTTLGEVLQ